MTTLVNELNNTKKYSDDIVKVKRFKIEIALARKINYINKNLW
jgi:ribosomal 50S subunit-associated protein YjgA (DUF615 family)